MSVVKILAPVTGVKGDQVTLATAFEAAKPFAAHVEVLFVCRDPREAVPYSDMPLPPGIVQDIIDCAEEARKKASEIARKHLHAAATEFGVTVVESPAPLNMVTASYREAIGDLANALADAAMLSDLVVIPPVVKGYNGDNHDALVRVLIKAGRPVLLCAGKKPVQLGKNIALGWDGRDAAAQALVAAAAILENAETIELISVGESQPENGRLSEAREYLALHNIRCAERVVQRGTRSIADALLDTASSDGCDLLVVGGYGHSRLMESVFGGVTEDIISHPTLPVLMVH